MSKLVFRRAAERGHAFHGWLDTHHTFSFAGYYDPEHMGFGALRVINDDRVAPGAGFPPHGHRDMEIISYVLSGALEHKDSMGHGSIVRAGEVQYMSAGTGIYHSEYNASDEEELRFLQIWLLPDRRGYEPRYGQLGRQQEHNRLRLVASSDGAEGSIAIRQDARVYSARLDAQAELRHTLAEGRRLWLHLATGAIHVDGHSLGEGDAVSTREPGSLTLRADEPSDLILFDLA